MVFENKGKGKKKKSQRAKIFGKENKRRTKKREKGKAQEGIAFCVCFSFFSRSTFLKIRNGTCFKLLKKSDTLRGV